MEYKVNCLNDTTLRNSFHALTQKVFHFQLKDWYNNGYWSESYEPHSLVDGNTVISNISVNHMHMMISGVEKYYLQIGTVMTDPAYRNLGLSRRLMESILHKYTGKVDGIYLFANDSVLDFYPKFGFKERKEFVYRLRIESNDWIDNSHESVSSLQKIDGKDIVQREALLSAAKQSIPNESFSMDNFGLLAFYLIGPLSDDIYYLPSLDTYVIASIENDVLFLHHIIASEQINPKDIVPYFGNRIKTLELGFTPFYTSDYEISTYHEDDCTLFTLGEDLESVETLKLRFPILSHS